MTDNRTSSALQPVAFTLYPDLATNPLPLATLAFPREWRPQLLLLEQERTGRVGKEVTLPIRPLNDVVTALFSQLMTVPGMVRNDPADGTAPLPWLVAHEPIPVDHLQRVIRGWCYETFGECSSLEQALAMLRADDLVWKTTHFPLETPLSNNTARPEGLAYTVLPAFLADRLVERRTTVKVNGRERALVRVPSDEGAELVSWPPVELRDKQHRLWYFSYRITLSVQTLVGNPQPRIHVHYGVRRWVSRSLIEGTKLYLGTTARSVYVRTTEPWMGLAPGPMFTRASIRATYNIDEAGGRPTRVPQWTGRLPAIATERLQISWPDAEQIARDPIGYLEAPGKAGIIAAIVEHTPRYHPVRQGLGLDEHEALTVAIQDALKDTLVLIPPLTQSISLTKPSAHSLDDNLRELSPATRLQGLVDSVSPNVTIEVWWQTAAWRNMVIDRIQALLTGERPPLVERPPSSVPDQERPHEQAARPLDDAAALLQLMFEDEQEEGEDDIELADADDSSEDEDVPVSETPLLKPKKPARIRKPEPSPEEVREPFEIALPDGGRLRVIPQPLGGIGAVFPDPGKRLSRAADRAAYQRTETQKRIDLIRSSLSRVTEPTLTCIELPNYQDPQKPQLRREFGLRDPKRAIRLGAALTGRLTKFSTAEEPLLQRATGTVLDGLRQLGYLPAPIGFSLPEPHQLPENMLVVGLWICRLTQKRGFVRVHLPIAVIFHTQKPRVLIWVPDNKGVRPFYQGLIDITTIDVATVQRKNQREALNELRIFLNNSIFNQGADDVVVLTEAQNVRMTMTGLQNPFIKLDEFKLDRSEQDTPIALRGGRMRVIRLRRSQRGETPEWYTPGAKAGRGYVQGIWPEPSAARTYYNLARKPHTMGGPREGKQIDPSEYYALPSMLEILHVALREDDDPDLWAYAIDQWRRMSYLTTDMTLMPIPLQWAEHVDRYAEVIGPWIFPEQWGTEMVEEGDEEEGYVQSSFFD